MRRWTWALVCTLVLGIPQGPTEAQQEQGTYAAARFVIDHPNGCTRTTAFVEVFSYPNADADDPPEEQSHVRLTYSVFGQPTSGGGCDGLFYYDLDGTALLDADAFSVQANRKAASLDTTVNVFDGESGTSFDVALTVEWLSTGGGRARTAGAVLSLSSPQISSLYTINPLSPSASAVIARLP